MTEPGFISMFELFREEVRAHAATLSQGLLELENDPGNPQRIEPLMRAAHSIKGAARIVDVEPAVDLAHVMEDALVAAQHGRIRIGAVDVDVLLRATDVLASLVEVSEDAAAAWASHHAATIAELSESLRHMAKGEPAPPDCSICTCCNSQNPSAKKRTRHPRRCTAG